ncbi:alpha/beta fold hydrolase [Flavisolibacter nicotianae]|uniref:alpha/beta fold hydrolase n=1 Tax=Flavisolibacter nicotianae TaxID=2364882 RepID=UPI000EB0D034|nr:alpha/beta hydrolase [Flavisolibacter nicotianae]
MKKNLFPISFILTLFYLCSCNISNTVKAQSETHLGPELKSIFINGDSIHYIDIGKGDPVVFVHGALGDYRTWQAQIDTFAKNHRVIVYSRRYAWPNQQTMIDSSKHSFASHANDLAEFLKKLDPGPAHLVGHSSGAYITLLAAIDHPELVRSLTLGEPPVMSLLPPPSPTDANPFAKAVEAFANNEQEKAVHSFVGVVTGDSSYFSRLSQYNRELMMMNTQEARANVTLQNIMPPVTCNDLKKINCPVLLLGGDKSPSFFPLIINKMEPCLRNKEKATLPNTSHGLEYENPSEFNKVVLGFIGKH